MVVYTLNVGQGQFVVVVGNTEAIIVDTFVPLDPSQDVVNVKSALAKILSGKELVGLMITGFDADHFNEIGMKIVLNKYRPNWIMYPKYFKQTLTANRCFGVIESFEEQKKFMRVSVSLSENNVRLYTRLSNDFSFEVFSPHSADMNSSNNCSLVCKIKENSSGYTYLVTGDTEKDRWDSIVRIFGSAIKSDILAAPHHGSHNGITQPAIDLIKPHTVLISAGVNSQYGHPDIAAVRIFKSQAVNCYQTNVGVGQSLKTVVPSPPISTYKFEV